MPQYLGNGQNFHLVSCELLPSPNVSFEEKKSFCENVCQRCGFWMDTVTRMERANAVGGAWRKLICVHPRNTAALNKWTRYITEWAIPPSV